MAQSLRFSIRYDTPFGPATLRSVYEALRSAVTENWARHRDRLSDAAPRTPVDVEAWLRATAADRLIRLDDAISDEFSEWLMFSYSPLSTFLGRLVSIRHANGSLGLSFSIAGSVQWEKGGEREKFRAEHELQPPPDAPQPWEPGYEEWEEEWYAPYNTEVWPVNRRCVLHIFERLCTVHPVREAQVDELLSGTAP